MRKMKKIYYFLPLLVMAGCAERLADCSVEQDAAVSAKIANVPDNADGGTLIARFDDSVIPELEEMSRNAALTKSAPVSAIPELDELFRKLEVVSFTRVFPCTEKYEADTRAAGLHKWYVLRFSPEKDLEQAASALAAVAQVTTVQYDNKLRKASDGLCVPFNGGSVPQTKAMVTSDFNDPYLIWQWHYINNADQAISTTSRVGADVNVAPAWKLTKGDPRVIVAVLDEGVKYTHPDLSANMWVNPDPDPQMNDLHGYNFVDDGPITWSKEGDSGHGTHVAGTIAAVNGNGIGVCGIAGGSGNGDGVRIMSCQLFSGENSTGDYKSSQAIWYAANHGASILQCSFGSTAGKFRYDNAFESANPLEVDAIRYFMSRKNCDALDGGLVFFSAGNDEIAMSGYPGAYRDYISVTAFAPDFLPAYYTNYGPGCNIAAPGGEITGHSGGEKAAVLSTLCREISDADYGYMQGTSMACPHMSGVAALALSYALARGKHFTRDEFNAMILTSVNDINCYLDDEIKTTASSIRLMDYYGKMGTGAIDAYKLMMQIEGTPCLTVPVGKLHRAVLTQFFGDGAKDLTYIGVEVPQETTDALGIEGTPRFYDGQLQIKCMKPGSGKIKVTAIAGGNKTGTGVVMGGIPVTKEFAVISREASSSNGGWF